MPQSARDQRRFQESGVEAGRPRGMGGGFLTQRFTRSQGLPWSCYRDNLTVADMEDDGR